MHTYYEILVLIILEYYKILVLIILEYYKILVLIIKHAIVCIGVSTLPQKHRPFFLAKQTVQAPFSGNNSPSILVFCDPSPNSQIFQWIQKILKFFILNTILCFKSNLLLLLLILLLLLLLLCFTPCKAEQPLQGMELQEKQAKKDYSI